MRPKKPAQPPVNVTIEPVKLVRSSYRPLEMNEQQRAAMLHHAEALRDAYLTSVVPCMVEALSVQQANCGKKSTNTVALVQAVDDALQKLVANLAIPSKVVWPRLPSLC